MTKNIIRGERLQYISNMSMGDFFFYKAECYADRICQIDATLHKTETYQDLKKRCVRVAIALQERGITSNDVIMTCTKISLDAVVPIIATFYLGSKTASLDPSLSRRHITHLLSLVSPKVIFVEEESVALIEESLNYGNLKTDIVVFGKSTKYCTFSKLEEPKKNEDTFRPSKVNIHDTAVIFFSSGTTGLSKAICHSHYSFLNLAHTFKASGIDFYAALSFTSFYWGSAMMLLTCTFIEGGHRIFCGPLEPKKTFEAIENYKVTYMFLAPILTLKLSNFEDNDKYNTASLQTITIGGTAINKKQLKRLSALFKNTHVLFIYGISEAGTVTLFNPKTEKHLITEKLGSCGKVVPGMSIKVVDIYNKILECNEKGEICVKGPALMSGYYKQDSSSAFDGDGFVKTGDIGYYDEDKCFYIIERIKEMFKYKSWHIVPSSIEIILFEHPAIQDSVVFGTPESEEDGELPTACVVLKENIKISEKDIEEFVAARVSNYEMLRGGVFFVDKLPRTPSGKLMRKETRNAFLKNNKVLS